MGTQRIKIDKRCGCGAQLSRCHRKSPFIDAVVEVCTNFGDPILMRPKCVFAVDPDDELDRAEAASAHGDRDDRVEESE